MYTLLVKNPKGLYVRQSKEWNDPDHPELRRLERIVPKWRVPLIVSVTDIDNALAILNHSHEVGDLGLSLGKA